MRTELLFEFERTWNALCELFITKILLVIITNHLRTTTVSVFLDRNMEFVNIFPTMIALLSPVQNSSLLYLLIEIVQPIDLQNLLLHMFIQ